MSKPTSNARLFKMLVAHHYVDRIILFLDNAAHEAMCVGADFYGDALERLATDVSNARGRS